MWHQRFRIEEKLSVPYCKSVREPKLFSYYPELRTELVQFCYGLVKKGALNTENEHTEIVTTLISKYHAQFMREAGGSEDVIRQNNFLSMFGLKKLPLTTVWRWLTNVLGFEYDTIQRIYYTDGHERDDVKCYRSSFFLPKYF